MSTYGDGEYASVCDSEWRKARKDHKCYACRELVRPGQMYHRTFMVFDGSADVTIRCARCQTIFEHLSARMAKSGDSEEFCAAGLNCGHDYEERWGEPPPESIAALAFWLPGDPLP